MPSKYPGRDRVMSREAARDARFNAAVGRAPASWCDRPVILSAIGLPDPIVGPRTALPVEIPAPCRKCTGCLHHRRRLWTARGVAEIAMANRTWFGTLTVEPFHRFLLKLQAQEACARRRAEAWDMLEPPEQFRLLADQLGREATKFLKRVRQQAGVPLRYLLVTEAHKSGDPHLHLLLHEPDKPIRKAMLEEQWRYGFSHWRLVDRDEKAAVYACKYLGKEALTRVRASLAYGKDRYKRSYYTEKLEAATRSLRTQGE